MERLAGLGKLWATVKWFHPWLAYRQEIDWDGAVARAIPKVNAARNREEYAAALRSLVAELGDPVTEVLLQAETPPKGPEELQAGKILRKTTNNGYLILTLPTAGDFESLAAQLSELRQEILQARGVVFDLRWVSLNLDMMFYYTDVHRLLFSKPVVGPGRRSRYHSGLVDENTRGSGGFYSAFSVQDPLTLTPVSGARDIPAAFVVSRWTRIPEVVLALHGAGKARLIAGPGFRETAAVGGAGVRLPEDLGVWVRTSEVIYPDGTTGMVPDAEASDEQGVEKALALLGGGVPERIAKRQPAPAVRTTVPVSPSADLQFPSAESRLIAAFQIWAVFEWFFPYRSLMGEDWQGVLREFIPRIEAARDAREYHLTVAEMVAHVHDSHASLQSPALSRVLGDSVPPLAVRWIENSPVVVALLDDSARAAGVEVGDVLLEVGGQPVSERMQYLSRYQASSTPQRLNYTVVRRLLAGEDGSEVRFRLSGKDGSKREIWMKRSKQWWEKSWKSDYIARPKVDLLEGMVGYADLRRISRDELDRVFDRFQGVRGLTLDLRGYPEWTVFRLIDHLDGERRVRPDTFWRPVLFDPNRAETLTFQTDYERRPRSPQYRGKIVVLIDESAISRAEYTAMVLKASAAVVFIGTPTAGANGDGTYFVVPGGIRIGMSGNGVRWPDGHQLQRVGVQPDIKVAPTIAGIRAGRDEVLERAVEYLRTGK